MSFELKPQQHDPRREGDGKRIRHHPSLLLTVSHLVLMRKRRLCFLNTARRRVIPHHGDRADDDEDSAERQHGEGHLRAEPNAQRSHHLGVAGSSPTDDPQNEQRSETDGEGFARVEQRTRHRSVAVGVEYQLKHQPEYESGKGQFVGDLACSQIDDGGNRRKGS